MNIDSIPDYEIWEKFLDYEIINKSLNFNLEQKKFGVKIYQKDIEYLNNNNQDSEQLLFIMIACAFCDPLTIKLLMNLFKLNANDLTSSHFFKACEYNPDLETILFLINNLGNVPCIDSLHPFDNCLIKACRKNSNIEIIKYLINKCNIDVNYKNLNNENCLFASCENENLSILKYLIDQSSDVKMNVCMQLRNSNTFILDTLLNNAISHNNYNLIKYLIEEQGLNFKINNNINLENLDPENQYYTKIIQYLSKKFWKNEYFNEQFYLKCRHKLHYIKNYKIVNNIIQISYHFVALTKDNYNLFLKEVNPLMINASIRHSLDLENPCKMNFKEFYNQVNVLQCVVPWTELLEKNIINEYVIPSIDYTIPNEQLLFTNNKINYYGNKNIVYNCIIFFKEIIDCADFSENIILEIIVPKSLMNLYLESCYTGKLDINKIDTPDMILFLKLIDQYPTLVLSINSLEIDVIHYFDANPCIRWYDIKYIIDMISKYGLKFMHLDRHNKMFIDEKINID